MIWIFLMVFAFPWIQIALFWLWRTREKILEDPWISYLVLWLLWTPLFFTFSKNIMHTYIVPILAPLALLVGQAWKDIDYKKLAIRSSLVFPSLALIVFVLFYSTGRLDYHLNTDKNLLVDQDLLNPKNPYRVFYWKKKSYSGQFYSKGRARIISDSASLRSLISNSGRFALLISKADIKGIPKEYFEQMTLLKHNSRTSMFVLKATNPLENYDSYKPATYSP